MCGITVSIALRRGEAAHTNGTTNGNGSHATNGVSHQDLEAKLSNSLDILAHRGPDARGIWISGDAAIGLAHNRLSINDLSPGGDQPIHSDDGRIHAVVNGEIYDFDRIREELIREDGYQFHGKSDSELVVALYRRYGAPEFLEHLRGEFALVLYDENTGDVIAARDRFGIKPLFWTIVGSGEHKRLLLAAEAKGFLPMDWQPEWDLGAIVDGGWQYDDRTTFKHVKKVLPGHWMQVISSGEIIHKRYWDMDYKDKRQVETRSVEEMVLGVREKLTEAIRLRLRADVPVGIYLSGGIDSSLVAGIVTHLVREQGVKLGNQDATSRIRCFTIQFPSESGFDESEIAQRTADFLGVQILKKRIDEQAMAEYFADAAYHCEHPMADLNSVGKFGLSTVPRENGFKVVLTGEGSDEHFSGYPLFLPDYLRERDYSLPGLPLSKDDELRQGLQQTVGDDLANKISKLGYFKGDFDDCEAIRSVNNVTTGAWLACWQVGDVFSPWVKACWADADPRLTISNSFPPDVKAKMNKKWHPMHTSHYIVAKTMLANILLSALGDRIEMAHSIEGRPPFLDHVLSDYVNSLPPSLKMGYTPNKQSAGDQGPWWKEADMARDVFSEKWILREAGKPFITKELYERKKHPYMAPTYWPKGGPLYQKLREICTRDAVEKLGFVDYSIVEECFETGFGEKAAIVSLRKLLYVGGWVTLSQRFGVRTVGPEDFAALNRLN